MTEASGTQNPRQNNKSDTYYLSRRIRISKGYYRDAWFVFKTRIEFVEYIVRNTSSKMFNKFQTLDSDEAEHLAIQYCKSRKWELQLREKIEETK